MTVGPRYARARTRSGKVSLPTQVFQGIGALPETIKNFAFGTFLLLYYNQVLGIPAGKASLAIAAALIIDAACDPVIGSVSDNLRSRLGRRHPIMAAAAIPMALGLWLTFSPPAGLGQVALVAWLFVSVVTTHIATSLFVLPWSALFAEFSDDYAERTTIVTWRFAIGGLGGLVFGWCVWTFVFTPTHAFPLGQLNPRAYPLFGPTLAVAVFAAIFVTTWFTRREIPYLLQPVGPATRFSLGRTAGEVAAALKNRDFLILFAAILIASGLIGTQSTLDVYLLTWFFGLGPHEMRWLTLAAVGAFVAMGSAAAFQARFDKKRVMLTCLAIFLIDSMTVVALRLAGILPANGDPALLPILVVNEVGRQFLVTLLWIMFTSMFADTLDSQELATGRRQEGVFSAAITFSGKATTGLGTLVGGYLLQNVVAWPAKAVAVHIPHALLLRLGVVDGLVLPALYFVPLAVCTLYSITRERHTAIRSELTRRRDAAAASGPAIDLAAILRAEVEAGELGAA